MAYRIPTAEEIIDYWSTVADRFVDPVWVISEQTWNTVQFMHDDDGINIAEPLNNTILMLPIKLTKSAQPIRLVEKCDAGDYR